MERSNEVIVYRDCQRAQVASFEEYLSLPGKSHSSIKSDKGGYSAPFNVTKKVMIGKIVDQILTDSGKVDYANENYPIAKKIAAYIQGQFYSILPHLKTQQSFTGVMEYKGLTMLGKGILDYLLPNFCVLDLKVTAEKNVDKLIEFMGYKNQLWHYGRLSGVKYAYILIYSTHKDNQKHPLRMIKIDISSPNNSFWENAVLNFGGGSMQIVLRDYQNKYVQEIVKAFSEGHKRIVLCAPTGSGKTVMFSEMVRRAAFKETSTWVLTDRTELFNQTFAALERVNVKPQLINANTKKHMISPDAIINVGMVETIFRRTGIKPPQLLILDEAHMGNFTKIIEQYQDSFVIGATATPIGKHFYKYYTKLIQCTDVPELIAENSLCPCKTIEMQNQDFSDLEMKAGEYTEASNYNHFAKRSLFDGLIEQIHKHIGQRKTIVYCVNVAHANETAALLIEHGFTAKVVTGETPDKEREYTFLGFKYGQFQFLVNVGVATKGYDEPSIEAVIMYLKTNSLAKYLQCVGRGGRTFAGKTYFIHLDFGGNATAHGTWDEPRQWKLEAPKKKQKKKAAPMKICPNCDAMLPAPARQCGFCMHEFVFNSDDELAKGVDVEVTSGQSKKFIGLKVSELSVEDLYELSKDPNKKFKSSYIWRIVRSKGELEVEKFAQLAGFKRGWLYRQLEQMQDNDFFDKVIA